MVPVLFTSYVPSMLLKKMANWNMNVTGAIKLLGTPMGKKNGLDIVLCTN